MTDSIRVFDPGFRVTDTSGNPVSGAKIKFYNAGGLVARTVYSDDDLSVSLGSTVTCDSAGAPAASSGAGGKVLVYTGTTAFKVVVTDSDDNTLFEFDNITGALDTSDFESDTALPRTPVILKSTDYSVVAGDQGKIVNVDTTGGDVAITLPSAITVGDNWRVTIRHIGTSNDVIIQTVSSQTINDASTLTLLYKYESVTLVSDGANWHVSEDGFIRKPAGTVLPQGRITLSSGTPILTTNALSTSVYYTPYVGNLIPIYSGTRFVPYEFSELTLTLVSQHTASGIFDVFGFLDGTTVRIGTGPVWTTITAGSGARGTGTGTTEIERVNGIYVNAEQITARNGTDTYTVAANKATYLGSIFIDSSAGQVTCHVSYDSDRKWGVWNAYNRAPIVLKMGDDSGGTDSGTSYAQIFGETNKKLTIFAGLAEEWFDLTLDLDMTINAEAAAYAGIGYNSTSAASGFSGVYGRATGSSAAGGRGAVYRAPPAIGINVINALFKSSAGTATITAGEAGNLLMARWMG